MGFLLVIHCQWLYDENVAFKIIDAASTYFKTLTCYSPSAQQKALPTFRLNQRSLGLNCWCIPPTAVNSWGGKRTAQLQQSDFRDTLPQVWVFKALFDSAVTIISETFQSGFISRPYDSLPESTFTLLDLKVRINALNVLKMIPYEHVLYVFILK